MTATPADFDALFRRAFALQTERQFEAAAAIYRDILAAGDVMPAWLGLGQCQMELGQREDALASLRQAAAMAPQSGAIRHLIAALSGGPPTERAPDDYLQWVFDGHAPSFESHLATLGYAGPEMIRRLADAWPAGQKRRILDLGCGTGLNAPLFRDQAAVLDGVDLSAGMLRVAAAGKRYDRLYKAELHEFLRVLPPRYDTMLATDVFIYIGNLEPLFRLIGAALPPGGELLCTIERGAEGQPVALMATGRYRQSDAHVRDTAAAAGFDVAATLDGDLRVEHGVAEPGRAYRLVRRG